MQLEKLQSWKSMISLLRTLTIAFAVSSSAIASNSTINTVTAQSDGAGDVQAVKLKRKIAISRFTNETQSGNSFLVSESGNRIGKQAADILSARLTDTGYFLMFERIDTGWLKKRRGGR
jgi:curli biogenesis system outer membrane secretion channel CsgG